MPIKVTRRQFAGSAAAAGSLLVWVRRGRADSYPQKPVTIVNPFAPGSISDAAARIVGQYLQQELGQPFVVENKVGAGGLLAATAVQRAQPDGHTLLLTASSSFSGAALYKSMPFDPVKDFTHISRIGSFPSFIAVNPGLPADTMAALVAYAKANPGKLSYGHGNNVGQLVGETLKRRTGIDIVRVAYRSNPAAVTDLIAGHIQIMVPDLNTGLPSVQSGKIRALAMLNRDRIPAMPDVPSLHETVMPGFDILPWCGLSAPANLPQPIVEVLAKTAQKALADPAIQQRITDAGVGLFPGGPQEFADYVKAQLANWERGDQRDGDPTGITPTSQPSCLARKSSVSVAR
jgi:tripartite-type tricarboxylate transporter receptor subunit TctC